MGDSGDLIVGLIAFLCNDSSFYAEFGGSKSKKIIKVCLMLTVQREAFQSISQDEKVNGVCTYPLIFQPISSLK